LKSNNAHVKELHWILVPDTIKEIILNENLEANNLRVCSMSGGNPDKLATLFQV